MQSPNKTASQTFPSLAICTNGARASIHAIEIQYKRTGFLLFSVQTSLFTSATVLLLNIWGSRRSGRPIDVVKEMADVQKCMDIGKIAEMHGYFCGRGWDILHELAYVGDLPPLAQSPFTSCKRDRDGNVTENRAVQDGRDPLSSPGLARRDDANSFLAERLRLQAQTSRISQRDMVEAQPPNTVLFSRMNSARDHQVLSNSQRRSGHPEPQQTHSAITAPDHNDSIGSSQNRFGRIPDPLSPSLWEADNDELGSLTFPSASESIMAMEGARVDGRQPSNLVDNNHTQLPSRQTNEAIWPMSPSSDDTLAMLMSMPMGFEWNDWDAYLSIISGMNDSTGAGSSNGYSG